MPVHDELGLRIKENYENTSKTRLIRRMPVIIRVDGKAFHTFTKGFKKPFDHILMKSMQETMKYLCENIQGCVLGYTQSDEISLLLVDYKKLNSDAWFDNEVQKICSISASMTTMSFNKNFENMILDIDPDLNFYYVYKGFDTPKDRLEVEEQWKIAKKYGFNNIGDIKKYTETYNKAIRKGAMFDSRSFNIPKEEVTNYFYWRQLDATRNSIQMVGQAIFSHKELHKKSCNDIQDMLHEQKGINWNDFTVPEKRGTCCIKKDDKWILDGDIPIFKGEDRKYIEELVYCEEE